MLGEIPDVQCNCPICEDTGVVTTFEPVERGGPLAPVGQRVCDCQVDENCDELNGEQI